MTNKTVKKAASILVPSILGHKSTKDVVVHTLANKLNTTFMKSTEIKSIINEIHARNPSIGNFFAEDLMIQTIRGSKGFPYAISALLFSKGFHTIATHRIAHEMYLHGRESIARYLQSTNSEVNNSDIHPAAKIGRACYLSSASMVVIGETSTVGDNCMILQQVTLGGTGKEGGDRHPKIGDNAILCEKSSILGNIKIGDGAVVNPASVVVQPVAPYTLSTGIPAKVVYNFRCQAFLDEHKDDYLTHFQFRKINM